MNSELLSHFRKNQTQMLKTLKSLMLLRKKQKMKKLLPRSQKPKMSNLP